jgi:hypothetical protein
VPDSRQAPTSATTSFINSLTRVGSYHIKGQRSMFNNLLLDGIDNNAYGDRIQRATTNQKAHCLAWASTA